MNSVVPPLPQLPGENEDYRYRPPGRSIIAVLSDEHLRLAALSAELTEAEAPSKDLASVVTAAVTRHLSAEEQYLYPAVKSALPDGSSIAEREVARDVGILKQLALLETTKPGTKAFRQLVDAIGSELHKHSKSCGEIFPRLREAVSETDLIRLGNRIEIAEEAAPSRPHPHSPATPPLNKVTDAALGAADKVRDALTGRKTYPDQL